MQWINLENYPEFTTLVSRLKRLEETHKSTYAILREEEIKSLKHRITRLEDFILSLKSKQEFDHG